MKQTQLQGPAHQGQIISQYKPVDCDFTDELESLSTRRQSVDISYFDESGQSRHGRGVITDMVTRDHADYLVLANEEEIRLDRIAWVRPTQ